MGLIATDVAAVPRIPRVVLQQHGKNLAGTTVIPMTEKQRANAKKRRDMLTASYIKILST
jgi:hypothetical protein